MSDADDTDISFIRKSNPGRQCLNQHVDETSLKFHSGLLNNCTSLEILLARFLFPLF